MLANGGLSGFGKAHPQTPPGLPLHPRFATGATHTLEWVGIAPATMRADTTISRFIFEFGKLELCRGVTFQFSVATIFSFPSIPTPRITSIHRFLQT